MKILLHSLAAGALILCSLSAAAEEYLFSGLNYTTATGSYSTSDRMTGSIQTSSAIPANATNLDISSLIDSFSFSDGVNTLTEANGSLSGYGFVPGAQVSTDSDGEIISWFFTVRDLPLADGVSEINLLMQTTSSVGDQVAPDAECTVINLVGCLTYVFPPGDTASAPAGSWLKQQEQGQPIPGLTGYSLALTTLGLLLLGARRLRRRS